MFYNNHIRRYQDGGDIFASIRRPIMREPVYDNVTIVPKIPLAPRIELPSYYDASHEHQSLSDAVNFVNTHNRQSVLTGNTPFQYVYYNNWLYDLDGNPMSSDFIHFYYPLLYDDLGKPVKIQQIQKSTTTTGKQQVAAQNQSNPQSVRKKQSVPVQTSEPQTNFNQAFAQARRQGLDKFKYDGKWYHTRTKEEEEALRAATALAAQEQAEAEAAAAIAQAAAAQQPVVAISPVPISKEEVVIEGLPEPPKPVSNPLDTSSYDVTPVMDYRAGTWDSRYAHQQRHDQRQDQRITERRARQDARNAGEPEWKTMRREEKRKKQDARRAERRINRNIPYTKQ